VAKKPLTPTQVVYDQISRCLCSGVMGGQGHTARLDANSHWRYSPLLAGLSLRMGDIAALARGGPVDQWISGGRCSHGGADARRKQREEPTTRHKGNWRVSCFCLRVKHPWFPTGVLFALPRSSILCGCINIPGRQVNAVWGRCPTAWLCSVCKKKLGVYWGSSTKSLLPSS
jgi:hypothetical protein